MNHTNGNLLHLLNQRVRLLNQRMNEKLKEYDLYTSQWAILYCLYMKGAMTQTDIWKYLNVEAPTVTRTITRLQQKGWLIRQPGSDKRQRIVKITEEAKIQLDELVEVVRNYEDEQIFDLTEEDEQQLRQLLDKIGSEGVNNYEST